VCNQDRLGAAVRLFSLPDCCFETNGMTSFLSLCALDRFGATSSALLPSLIVPPGSGKYNTHHALGDRYVMGGGRRCQAVDLAGV
jgi:hypothetical protein